MIIDIHNHMLFQVDDGPEDFGTSVSMLEIAKKSGVVAIICTPHYRVGMFDYPVAKISESFELLKQKAKEYEIDLRLGCEYHVNSDIIDDFSDERVHTLAESDYCLIEFKTGAEREYIRSYVLKLLSAGYLPVIAHIERCECVQNDWRFAIELAEMGAYLQVNADGILGNEGKRAEKLSKKLLKEGLIFAVASDAHDTAYRSGNLLKCHAYVEKKYGVEVSRRIFYLNPSTIIDV